MRFKKTILLLIILVTISGCNSNNNNSTEIKTLDKAPDSLGDINKGISQILKNNGNIERIELDIDIADNGEGSEKQDGAGQEEDSRTEQPQEGSNGESNQGDGKKEGESSEGNSSQGSSSESHGSEETSQEDKKKEMSEKTWSNIDKLIEDLYDNLLSYENDAIKKGASQERLVKLKDGINKLVKAVEERSVINIYDYGSQSLLYLKPFYDLYKDDYRGEICEIKYNIYQYYLKAITGDKEGARNQLASKDENINKIRLMIGEDEKKTKELEEISTSLDSVGISLDENSKRVFILEKDTLIKKIESLE